VRFGKRQRTSQFCAVRNMWRTTKKRCWRPSAGRRLHTLSTVRRWARTRTVVLFAVRHYSLPCATWHGARQRMVKAHGWPRPLPCATWHGARQRLVHGARWTTPFAVRRASRRTEKVNSDARCTSPFAKTN
jgi:hypothetical protein